MREGSRGSEESIEGGNEGQGERLRNGDQGRGRDRGREGELGRD